MTDQPCFPVLIINRILKFPHRLPHGSDSFVQCRMMQQAVFYGNYMVGSLDIDSAFYLSALGIGKGRNCFIPIMPGIFHSNNGLWFSEIPQKFFYLFLLFSKLLFVRKSKHGTAPAALLQKRAGKLFLFLICFFCVLFFNFQVFPSAFLRFLHIPAHLPGTVCPAALPDRSDRQLLTVCLRQCLSA